MSIAAIDPAPRARPTLRATVDLPEPDPPAIPMISGRAVMNSNAEKAAGSIPADEDKRLSRSCTGEANGAATMNLAPPPAAVNVRFPDRERPTSLSHATMENRRSVRRRGMRSGRSEALIGAGDHRRPGHHRAGVAGRSASDHRDQRLSRGA